MSASALETLVPSGDMGWAAVMVALVIVCAGWCVAQAVCPVGDGGHLRLAREHLAQQNLMYFWIGVEASVCQDGELVVKVGGLAQGGQHHSAGSDTRQHQVAGLAGTQQHLKIAAGERGHPALGHRHLTGRRRDHGRDPNARVTVGEPASPGGGEKVLLRSLTSG